MTGNWKAHLMLAAAFAILIPVLVSNAIVPDDDCCRTDLCADCHVGCCLQRIQGDEPRLSILATPQCTRRQLGNRSAGIDIQTIIFDIDHPPESFS